MTLLCVLLQDTVAALNISGNVDNPEGGLDALVQVAVCEQVKKEHQLTTASTTRTTMTAT